HTRSTRDWSSDVCSSDLPSVRTVCARLGASFLSAVADRFGLWGPHGAKNVSWGDFAHFVEYTGAVTSLFPSSLTVSFAWAATVRSEERRVGIEGRARWQL